MALFGPTPVEQAALQAIDILRQGGIVTERQLLDLKEESGRRDKKGNILPGSLENEPAAEKLAGEVACMANTPGGGALILGVSNSSFLIGTNLNAEWLRNRIYHLLQKKITPDIQETMIQNARILVLIVPQAVEPIRHKNKITWRVSDECQEMDASSFHQTRLESMGFDWSSQPSDLGLSDIRPIALETLRNFITERDGADSERADLTDADLLRRLGALRGDGRLSNAAALLFVGRGAPALQYIRRDHAGTDSIERVRLEGKSVLEELQATLSTLRSFNPIAHLGEGLVIRQVRQIPERAVRESIINGLAHREWTNALPTTIEHIGHLLRVTSPGGFTGGVTPSNIINHPSTSRNNALADLLRSVGVAEREGVGVDRMFGEMLQLGYKTPSIEEHSGNIVVSLLATRIDHSWISWLARFDTKDVRHDLRLLMTLHLTLSSGWIDASLLGPYLQLPVAEAAGIIDSIQELRLNGHPAFRRISGTPSDTPVALALTKSALDALLEEDAATETHRQLPSRESLAQSFATQRGRISSTELGSLALGDPTNQGRVLRQLENQGILTPAWPSRRGQGFHYLHAGTTGASTVD